MRFRRVVGPVLLSACLSGCSEDSGGGGDALYQATVRWTSFGVPHIEAADMGSIGFAQGYVFARGNACELADQVVKVRSERARFFGPGEDDVNVNSDLGHLALGIYENAELGFPQLSERVQEALTGYAAGYNAYIEEVGADLPVCGGQPWVQPITPTDLFAHYVELGTLASGRNLFDFIATAQPPGANQQRGPDLEHLRRMAARKPGSNGWAIGSDRSEAGRGMLIANPHFPWEGELKLYESHLTIPGELDVYGASLMGVVGVLIGFTQNVAWTHTVSGGNRFTAYSLDLDPNDPTVYLYDGQPRAMTSQVFMVDVLQPDGSIQQVSRTLWFSHYGPMLNVEPIGWASNVALTFRDANDNNLAMIEQFMGMDRAQSMAEFQQVHADNMGLPWVNTMATSSDGIAWYADTTPTPNLTQEALDLWQERIPTDFLTGVLFDNGIAMLDGSDSRFEWVEEAGARAPGLVPFSRVPQLQRNDYVFNANDSHWISNVDAPLTGFSPMHGFENTPRTPRTRMNATVLSETGPTSASGDDGRFSLGELQTAILNNRGMMAELLRDEVVTRCSGAAPVAYEGATVDVAAVCDAIAGWNLRLDLDAPGAVAWREFVGDFENASTLDAGALFAEPFDAANPITTPSGLAAAPQTGDDRILRALAAATTRLAAAGIDPAAPLRDVQFTKKGAERIPIHGGQRFEGVTNLIIYNVLKSTLAENLPRGEVLNAESDLTTEGYVVNYGTSFIMALEFTDAGPNARAFLTYSQSGDPASPNYADQTRRFSDKQWRDILFTQEDILANPDLVVEELQGGGPASEAAADPAN